MMEDQREKHGVEPRIDQLGKATGRAKYIEDIPVAENIAYGAVLCSPYSHARLLAVDSSRALRYPGVLGVLDREHLDGLDPMMAASKHALWQLPRDQSIVAVDKVRFDGEMVTLVAADTLEAARNAVGLVQVEYEPLPAVFDASRALDDEAPILHEGRGSNLLLEDSMGWGDVEKGFAAAHRIFEETYTSPSMFHHPMENVGGCVASFLNGEIDLWEATSSPSREANSIAQFFGVDLGKVRIRVPYVGGGFGAKLLTGAMLAALSLSRKVGRPIKLVASAEESFRTNARHAMVYKARMGVKRGGTISALDVDLTVDTGAYATGGDVATHNAVISAWGCYRIPNVWIRARCVYTNKVPAGHARATGKVQTTWGVERMMDSAADQLGIEPVEFRKKNVLRRHEFVAKGTPLMDTDYLELMDRCTSAIGWDGRKSGNKLQEVVVESAGRYVKGRGIALGLRHGSQDGVKTYAKAILGADGFVTINHTAPEIGQGTHNLISIIAGKTLGLAQNRIIVPQPDTAFNLQFAGVNAQRTTMQLGKAVQDACEKLKREMFARASEAYGNKPEEWKIYEGRVCCGEVSLSFQDIGSKQGRNAIIECLGIHDPPQTESGSAFHGIDHWAPSVGAAEVEVDPETGEFRVLKFSIAVDAGKAIHYPSAKAQALGGAVMGFGHALFEEVVYQEGQMLNGDPFQYRLPVMKDIPEFFHLSILENEDGPGPFGSKGMSQTSIVTVAPAIGNAIFDAVGARITSLPITPEKILRALEKVAS